MTTQIPSHPFWPSRRLWLKFFVGMVYVPFLFSLLIWVFLIGSFSSSSDQVQYMILFALILIGGPVSVGLLLMPSWRGVSAGILATVSILLMWNWIGHLGLQNLPKNFGESLGFVLISASGVSVLEFIVRDVTRRNELGGLGIGIVTGFLLSLLYVSLFSPYLPKIDIPSDYSSIFGIVGWSAQFAISWISAFLFIEFHGRRVGWGGVIILAMLIGVLFSVSFLIMK